MKKLKYLLILLIISLLLFIPSVKAFNPGACIKNYGNLSLNKAGFNTTSNKQGAVETISQSANNNKYTSTPKSWRFEIKARSGYYITNIYYRVGNCTGEITGIDNYVKNYYSSYDITMNISKGYTNKVAVWGVMQNVNVASSRMQNGTTTTNPKLQLAITKRIKTIKFYDNVVTTTKKVSKTVSVSRVKCEIFRGFIKQYWSWVLILMPIATIILIAIDLLKVIISSDPMSGGGKDTMTLKKVGHDAVKRMVALVVLMILPFILSTLFAWFGFPFCAA